VWWAGCDPKSDGDPGLKGQEGSQAPVAPFRSVDGGKSWEEASGLRRYLETLDADMLGSAPGGAMLHSIRTDPRDGKHLLVSVSTAGSFESYDGGESWKPLNKGVAADFLPDGDHEYGQDPHCLILHPANPDRLYQQNHCGIYRLDRPGEKWERIGNNMPKEVGDIGFPIVAHPRNADVVWVFPMDGGTVWPRTSPRREAGRLPDERRRAIVGAARQGSSGRKRALDRATPGDDVRLVRSGRTVFRHDQRRSVDERRRGSLVAAHRRASPLHPVRDDREKLTMQVKIPSQLYSYTGGLTEVDCQGASLAEVLGDLEARFPGLRFRIVDEQDHIRPHIRFFVNSKMARDIKHPLEARDVVKIVGALSGG